MEISYRTATDTSASGFAQIMIQEDFLVPIEPLARVSEKDAFERCWDAVPPCILDVRTALSTSAARSSACIAPSALGLEANTFIC